MSSLRAFSQKRKRNLYYARRTIILFLGIIFVQNRCSVDQSTAKERLLSFSHDTVIMKTLLCRANAQCKMH